MTTVLNASPQRFVNTPAIQRITQRALRYLQSGFSVHLRGAAGVGKTTLAMHLADLLNQPIILLFGDDEFKTSDLIGNQLGYTRKKVVDNFIHSVIKVEDELRQHWVDARLTLACKEGFTLVYDEFNRSHPEVNNVLLSVLEERLLVLPTNQHRAEYIRVHPQFRAILTSNPQEYCGVHATQDALMDRVITIDMPPPDELTQQEIVIQKTGIDSEKADKIVRLVRMFWSRSGSGQGGGLRSCLMIGRICHEHEISVNFEEPNFQDICADILLTRTNQPRVEAIRLLEEVLSELHRSTNTQFQPPEIISESQNQIVLEQRVPYEYEVYNYLCKSPGKRFSDLATELGIDRSQIVAALKSLREQGVLLQMQGNAELPNVSQVAFDSSHLINK
ncbi:ATPase AAA [Nostoc linckia z18]|uniref:ATPase AAA n=2 Tax=Nostoc linckia TaxID=92942 RepID=A0A9Q6ELK2_NOSLI|nr:gas vesicle protein GvpN [Nostoc linckia]PHK40959.1 ATPase AAA [Nostoc linckia z15]PHK46183.1 ATPase AAA [Nostoc linckia z16]PHJ62925.1 ATPase AAA [Nostoc linckia z1]PHJ66804.1 ATPase AAA [Nostoc linckia z3]PHJ70218.1 ATPase AAA [Nostoc linckia z2]